MKQEQQQQHTENNYTELSKPELLIKFVEQDPSCAEVLELTQEGKKLTPQDPSLAEKISSVLIANPKDYYGNAYVTDELKKHAKITANTNSFANIIDFVSNAPFYFFCFKFLGNFPAVILGLLIDVGVLSFSNITASTVANRTKKNRGWANIGIFGMVSISILKTLVSGIGVELLNNPTGIQQQTVDYLVAEQRVKVEDLNNSDTSKYEEAEQKCQQGTQDLQKMTEGDRNYDALYQDVHGLWSERNKDWSNAPKGQKIPLCIEAKILEQQHYAVYEDAKETLDQKLSIRAQRGNDLAFLRDEFPELYEFHFDEEGNLRSAVTQVSMATRSFFSKLLNGEFADLGLGLFFFSLSVISSAAAVFITIKYANREDVLKSRDEDFARQRDIELEEIYHQLLARDKEV
ncbi:hypothetical protein IQ215_02740 [Cyanobacterium stanieri LEGE 03274]|uniref:Uncharacterized protein n=1 Tax=Cyanobacterium stanieri LEGE 03274 TaxID=1828756 RepID=A0ABR9V137_9CHRO|nr:hypothetical protein [Cyanobacterium stanieri]MBE9221605.1 hypothetical protein [Cyanobacterium stanieri LEGE 03274]